MLALPKKSTRNVTEYVDRLNRGIGRSLAVASTGFLHPLRCKTITSDFRLGKTEFIIGRNEPSEGIDIVLADNSVSRRHAKIVRRGGDYWIVDLESSNGTFVENIPIRSCLLHAGDTIQIGESKFLFERRLEREALTIQEVLTSDHESAPTSMLMNGEPNEAMSIRFWGTRGSIPTPGETTRVYGGNTTCLEIRHNSTSIVFDAGSGIRELCNAWLDSSHDEPIHTNLVFTHLHWDHIQGFPFCRVAYDGENSIDVFSAGRDSGGAEELLSGQMQGAYFPVPISAMHADIRFHTIEGPFEIDGVSLQPFELPHPGGCLGYRLTAQGSSLVIATDCELDQVAENREQVSESPLLARVYDPEFLEPFLDAALLVIDCQYTDDEYRSKQGWGHNSIGAVADFCRQTNPSAVALTHHDPDSTDEMVAACAQEVADRLAAMDVHDVLVYAAREDLAVSVSKPLRPQK